eukprot:1158233-Pelagomonas_calceolata.AAC.8
MRAHDGISQFGALAPAHAEGMSIRVVSAFDEPACMHWLTRSSKYNVQSAFLVKWPQAKGQAFHPCCFSISST